MKLIRKTKRLTIRPLKASDYLAWSLSRQEMMHQRNEWDRTISLDDITKKTFKNFLASSNKSIKDDQFYFFGVFSEQGEMIGEVTLMDISRMIFQNAYIGYRIYSKYWKMGYGKEAVTAVIDIAFKDLKLHRLEAGIEPRNRRSIALAKTLGFRKEGFSKKRLFLQGRWKDFSIYALTSEDVGINWKTKR